MDKSYFYMLDPIGLLLSPLYIFFLIVVLIYISKQLKVGFSAQAITVFYLYYYLFAMFSTAMPFVPDLPDTKLFGEMITNNYFPSRQSLGVRLFYVITYPIRILSLFKLELFILFQIFIFIISLMVLWKSWQIVLVHEGQDKHLGINLFLVLAAMYPAFLLYIPIPLREFFILLGFSIMMYGIISKYYNHKGMLYIFLGSILLLFGRPQLIVVVVLFLAIFQKNKWLKYGFIIASIFLIPILFSSLMSYKFNPEFFEYLRNSGVRKHGILAYGLVDWHTYLDIIMDLPGLVSQFLLSPFPILHNRNPLNLFAIFIDAIFSLFIYMSVIYAGIKVSKIYIFVFLLSATLFSIWEYHIAGAVRHRLPLTTILLPVASYGLLKLYQDIKAKL